MYPKHIFLELCMGFQLNEMCKYQQNTHFLPTCICYQDRNESLRFFLSIRFCILNLQISILNHLYKLSHLHERHRNQCCIQNHSIHRMLEQSMKMSLRSCDKHLLRKLTQTTSKKLEQNMLLNLHSCDKHLLHKLSLTTSMMLEQSMLLNLRFCDKHLWSKLTLTTSMMFEQSMLLNLRACYRHL